MPNGGIPPLRAETLGFYSELVQEYVGRPLQSKTACAIIISGDEDHPHLSANIVPDKPGNIPDPQTCHLPAMTNIFQRTAPPGLVVESVEVVGFKFPGPGSGGSPDVGQTDTRNITYKYQVRYSSYIHLDWLPIHESTRKPSNLTGF